MNIDPNSFSTLYYDDKLTFPLELLEILDLNKDDKIAMGYSEEGFFFWKKGKQSKFDSEVDERGAIRLDEKLIRASKIKSGDVLLLEIDDNKIIKGRHFDGLDLPSAIRLEKKILEGKIAPPGWMCQSFTSNPSSLGYSLSGKASVDNFQKHLGKHGAKLESFKSIFDFGCGAGRVLSAIHEVSDASLTGVDLHVHAINWCKEHLAYGDFHHGSGEPPLDIKSNQFDFIYAISVFTHLNERMQNLWLEELKRISKPNAILILSYRGDDYIEKIIAPRRANMLRTEMKKNNGFVFLEHKSWEGILPDYYCDSFHTHNYIKKKWGEYFEVLELIPQGGFSNKQNAVVLRNVKAPSKKKTTKPRRKKATARKTKASKGAASKKS